MAVAGGMTVVIRLNSGFVPHVNPVEMLCPTYSYLLNSFEAYLGLRNVFTHFSQ